MRLGQRILFGAILSLISLSLWLVTPLREHGSFGGTFIGAIICDDGIVVGSDSRSTFLNSEGGSIGYVDGTQKIYASSTTAIAISGLTSVDGEMFNAFVDRNAFLMDRTPDEVLFGFSAWLPFKNSTNVLLLSAGYVDGKAMVCARSVTQPQDCRASGLMTNKPSPFLKSWIESLRAMPRSGDAAAALKQAIAESAAGDRTVGGPINLVQLRPASAPLWLENPPRHDAWRTVCELVRDYREGRVSIVATTGQPQLDRYLDATCPR